MIKRLLLFWIIYIISNQCFSQDLPQISIIQNPVAKKADIFIGAELFTSLLYADSLKKPVLYPVNAPGNITVTRGWPLLPKNGDQVDHPHQIGVWFNYGDVNGADYWNNSTSIDTNKKAYGTIKLNRIVSTKNGNGKAQLVTSSTWYNPKRMAVLEEITTYTFSINDNDRIIDRKTALKAIEDILFKDNKEGLFAIRVARELEHPFAKAVKVYTPQGVIPLLDNEKLSGKYESSEGIMGEDVFATRSNWLKLSGKITGKPVSIAMIDHPKNIGYPGYWFARGYGLFANNPLGAEAFTNGKETLNFRLAKGKTVVFRHRLVISNELKNSRIEQLSNSFKTQ
ncbi:MAG: PmoA family protein [Sphingobacteriaceae bacterium]|nr:PmoA family protein [Sphingobacteriaceae bacterium]